MFQWTNTQRLFYKMIMSQAQKDIKLHLSECAGMVSAASPGDVAKHT